MRALKTILIVMAVFIAAGFAFIGYEVYKRSTDPNYPRTFSARFGTGPSTAPAAPPTNGTPPTVVRPAAPMPTQAITLPHGASILPGMVVVGDRLAIQVELADGRVYVLLIDPATGEYSPLVTTSL